MRNYKFFLINTHSEYHSPVHIEPGTRSFEELFGAYTDISREKFLHIKYFDQIKDDRTRFILYPSYFPYKTTINLNHDIIDKINNIDNTYLTIYSPHECSLPINEIIAELNLKKIKKNKVLVLSSNYEFHKRTIDGVRFICLQFWWLGNFQKHLTLYENQSSIKSSDRRKNIDFVSKKFISLNRNIRPQRIVNYHLLHKTGLINEGYVSFHIPDVIKEDSPDAMSEDQYKEYIKNSFDIFDISLEESDMDILLKSRKLDDLGPHVINYQDSIKKYYETSLFSIITESGLKENFVTEKTFKAMAHCHPFIIIGNKSISKRLNDMGFKTFEKYFDADNPTTGEEISQLFKKIKDTPLSQWKAKTKEVIKDIHHNWSTVFNLSIPWASVMEDIYHMIDQDQFQDSLCLAPWTHLSVYPNGDTYPCCLYNWETPIGNINNGKIIDVWNSDSMKQIRLNMLSNKKNEGCSKCNTNEQHGVLSYRKHINEKFQHHFNKTLETNPDGSLDTINLPYFDFRFSNLCNMKCRTCGPHFSSKWHTDIDGKPNVISFDNDYIWKEIEEFAHSIEEIYFTGGESLFMPQHYRLLDMLIKRNLKPKLIYNSNGSKIEWRGKHISEYWNHFNNIEFNVSIDHIEKKAEYIRHGQKWKTIFSNLCWIRDNMSGKVTIKPNLTVSIFNVYDLLDIVDFLYKNKLATKYYLQATLLFTPEYFNIQSLSLELKNIISSRLSKLPEIIEKYRDIDITIKNQIIESIDGVNKFMHERDLSYLMTETKIEISRFDTIRNENFKTVFPELYKFYESK